MLSRISWITVMPDISQVFYEGIRGQVKRVVGILGAERTEAGMTAFDDGSSNWSQCFFARALQPERLYSEYDVARLLGLRTPDGRLNLVPVRIVYRTFDGMSSMITKKQLLELIRALQDEYNAPKKASTTMIEANKWLSTQSGKSFLDMLKKINYTGVESTPLQLNGPSCG